MHSQLQHIVAAPASRLSKRPVSEEQVWREDTIAPIAEKLYRSLSDPWPRNAIHIYVVWLLHLCLLHAHNWIVNALTLWTDDYKESRHAVVVSTIHISL